MNSRTELTGLQIAFFIFALSIVCIPLSRVLMAKLGPGWDELQLFRFVMMLAALAILLAFPRVRRASWNLVARPIPHQKRIEVTAVTMLNALMPFAFIGLFGIWTFMTNGAGGPEALLARQRPADAQMAWAFSRSGIFQLMAAVFAAPILEELIFRGFLFKAWERRWGWRWSAILTSATFAIYHINFFAAFVESLVYIFVFRRTGSLAAPILVHSIHNLVLLYPVFGQFIFPAPGSAWPGAWSLQLGAAVLALILFPVYARMADRNEANAEIGNDHAGFPRATSSSRPYD